MDDIVIIVEEVVNDIDIIVEEVVNDIVVVVEYPQVGSGIQDIIAGANVSIDNTDPTRPIINATGEVTSGVATVTGEFVNNADPFNPKLEGINAALGDKVDKIEGKQLSDQNYTLTEKQKLATLENFDDSAILSELDDKVDKVNGKQLSDENYSLPEKQKLSSLENYNDSELRSEVENKVDKITGKVLSDENYTTSEKSKLASLNNFDDSGIQSQIGNKVDKVTGYGLSKNDYTDDEKEKLAGLESPKYKGQFVSLQALIDANVGEEGANAYVDEGEGSDVVNYIWDTTDATWIIQQGSSTAETPTSIKSKYESNVDTNAFTDSDKDKLSNIEAEATKNDTDANLKNRANHTGEQSISTVTGLQTALDEKQVKETGKGLSEENYSLTEKNKLASITAIFTTELKTAYDNAVTWISTNGANLINHLTANNNPHSVTKSQVGLGNADNTSDADKPISTATQNEINAKAPLLTNGNFLVGGSTTNTQRKLAYDDLPSITVATADNQAVPLSQIGSYRSIVTVSANKTLALTDANTLQLISAARSITVPNNTTVAIPVNSRVDFKNGGAITFVASSGVTIQSKANSLVSNADNGGCTLVKVATNTWWLVGDLT